MLDRLIRWLPLVHRGLGLMLALLTGAVASARPSVPQTVERDSTLPTVELRNYRFHAQTFGPSQKPMLIVLHGGPGADYRYLLGLQALADEYLVVFYDQRGSGLSPRVAAETITPQVFIDDLDAFVDAYGKGRPVHLLGHSWGAMLASAYTGAHPEKVDHLVLAEPGFLDAVTRTHLDSGGWPGWHVVMGVTRAWMAQWWVDPQGDPHARSDFFLGAVFPLFQGGGSTCDGKDPHIDGWRAGSPAFEATIGRMQRDPAFAEGLDFRAGVDAFRGPTLFLAGACSQVMGAAQQRRHLHHFQQARLEIVPQAGHFMFNDQPEVSLGVVRAFLRERPARP